MHKEARRAELSSSIYVGIADRMMTRVNERFGQAAYNYCALTYPKVTDEFNATHLDPFYRDERVDNFVDAVVESILKEEYGENEK